MCCPFMLQGTLINKVDGERLKHEIRLREKDIFERLREIKTERKRMGEREREKEGEE